MEMTFDIPESLVEWIIKEVMGNMPEASRGACLRCTHWNYDRCEFRFFDCEDESHTAVNYPMLRKGFDALMKQRTMGYANFCGWDIEPLLTPTKERWEEWAGQWDADVVDGLVQCAIFGEIVYG
jgi:hypothetical protein